MPDYSKTVIYKIQHEDNEELVYIGSTTDFTKRKYRHKCNSNNPTDKSHFKLYKMINENGGWSCFNMIQIKEFSCNNKREAEAEEDAVMLNLKTNMNSHRAYRNKTQYYEDNKEKIQGYIKEYRNDNQEKIKGQMKEYYNKNKDKILQQRKEKIMCDCGFLVNKINLTRHKKTKKHTKLLNETTEQ